MTGGELVKRLEVAAFDAEVSLAEMADLLLEAAAELRAIRFALLAHRGARDWVGHKIDQDRTLWEFVADVPWGTTVRGDG